MGSKSRYLFVCGWLSVDCSIHGCICYVYVTYVIHGSIWVAEDKDILILERCLDNWYV